MAQQLFANNAGSTLAGALTNVSTTANLAAGTGALFPSPGAGQYFVGTFVDVATGLINEIVWVTSRTGDQITMTRAQEGTTAKAWNSGDLFKALVTAGALSQMLQTGQYPEQAFTHTGTDTGGTNTIVATLAPAIVQYDVGAVYQVKLLHDITGASTVNFNSIGAVALKRADGTDTQAGDGYAGNVALISWNGATAQLMSRPPATGQFFAPSVQGLVISVATNTTLSVGASKAVITTADSTKAQIASGVSLTLNAGVVGVNGIDVGSLSTNTWYYVWLIGNGTSMNSLLSLSSTSPTLPAGYTFLKYCGAVRTDGASHFISSIQKGASAQWVAPPDVASGTSGSLTVPTWVSVSSSNSAPPTAIRLRGFAHATNSGQFMLAPNNTYGAYNSANAAPCVSVSSGSVSVPFDFELEVVGFFIASNDSGGASPVTVFVLGWLDGSF